jgi:Thioredoxin-like
MRFVLMELLLAVSASFVIAGSLPVTAKELALMLRSGFSSEAAMHEVSVRHFAGGLDAATGKELIQAGANEELIAALQSGAYKLSASESAVVQEKLAAQEQRAAFAIEQSATPPERQTDSTGSKTPAPGRPGDAVYRLLKHRLVYCHLGSLSHFDDEALERKKLYLFFFSANWSPQGRKLTPQLIEYYNRVAPQHPEFEVIFFSADRSLFGMETYMVQSNMPWPAADYDKLAVKDVFQKELIGGVPSLVLTDASGNILSNSYAGEKDLGPEKVLADLDKVFASGNSSALVRRP